MSNIKELQKQWKNIGSSPVYFIHFGTDDMFHNSDSVKMTAEQEKCKIFFDKLADILKDDYTVLSSCNKDFSKYLCVKGTEGSVSYTEKPNNSFRISDHWNWYANLKKCPMPKYIQCYSSDAPWPRRRPEYGKASQPWHICQVAVFANGRYKAVYGECYDKDKKKRYWLENSPEKVAELVRANAFA